MRTAVFRAGMTLGIAAILFAAAVAAGSAVAADRRLIVTPQADYPGHDLSTIKNVGVDQCQAACLSNDACRAFTFNTKAGWCFLKSDFGALTSTPDATAGRVVEAAEVTPSLERQRLGDLSFLPQSEIDGGARAGRRVQTAVRRQPRQLRRADRMPVPSRPAPARTTRQPSRSGRRWRSPTTIRRPGSPSPRRASRATRRTTPTAWAHGRTPRPPPSTPTSAPPPRPTRPARLPMLGDALARRENWKPAIRAYRASLALVETPALRATYEKAWPSTASASSRTRSRPTARRRRSASASPTRWR